MNPYAHFRVCDAHALVDEYREQAQKLLLLLDEATALMKQSGHGDMIVAGRRIDLAAGDTVELTLDPAAAPAEATASLR